MLTSKQVMDRAEISRATLNNYIALGILPRPSLRQPDAKETTAPRLGYFPAEVLDRIVQVNELKIRGVKMSDIARMFKDQSPPGPATEEPETAKADLPPGIEIIKSNLPGDGMRLSLDQISSPAYMVNNNFELEWWNTEATELLFPERLDKTMEIGDRNIFKLFGATQGIREAESWDVLRDLHLCIAKKRMARKAILALDVEVEDDPNYVDNLLHAYDHTPPLVTRAMIRTEVNLGLRGQPGNWFHVYASFFREGIFFVYEPFEEHEDNLSTFLSRRDVVIRELMRNRRPYLTPLAVLVADLQSSTKICAELPPEEYFELINSIWSAVEPNLRRFQATHGKHVGDGMVYYFLPQPDSCYIENALHCAAEMRKTMREISRKWRSKKNWLNELRLNIGIHEGEEWFGTYQTPTHLEFTVLGDTINQAARLSDFARKGSIWVSKVAVSKLTYKHRQRLHFGIRRRSEDGKEILVDSTFSRIANLVDLNNPKNEKFQDIGTLPVTEVLDMDVPD
ncbi:adenylate/guanylate cyclase domain-containing protein [Magnetospira sp. QH-2]|uniref:adenylate/guanylate cyclase domain-containing protein n=1 Tax=Magnetospira sp. (strain QH-2) TaxID=1288970 RepID=UPI0005F9DB7C|nr:adenylate/guanylate cyclase domain-containing protein [Magnetospira sp. QH-2]